MPIDINLLRNEKGGNIEYWRGVMGKRCMDVALVDRVVELDQVCGPPPSFFPPQGSFTSPRARASFLAGVAQEEL